MSGNREKLHVLPNKRPLRNFGVRELEEESFLKKSLPQIKRISHIGSTAVSSIWAKPIIDILVEVPKGSDEIDTRGIVI